MSKVSTALKALYEPACLKQVPHQNKPANLKKVPHKKVNYEPTCLKEVPPPHQKKLPFWTNEYKVIPPKKSCIKQQVPHKRSIMNQHILNIYLTKYHSLNMSKRSTPQNCHLWTYASKASTS